MSIVVEFEQGNASPRIVRVKTTDSLTAVTTAGWLNGAVNDGLIIQPSDKVMVYYGIDGTPGNAFFDVSIASGVITLSQSESNIVLPTVANDIAIFNGVDGGLSDSGVDYRKVLQSSLSVPDVNSNLIWVDISAGFAALASAAKVEVAAAATGKSYRIRDLKVNYLAAGLSGGGGDRLLSLTDGTTAWNGAGITAALLGTPVNTVWGGTGNPLPGTVAMNTASVAGAQIYLQYAGGTTDYTAGNVSVSVLLERVA
jgi:hypothetical protein